MPMAAGRTKGSVFGKPHLRQCLCSPTGGSNMNRTQTPESSCFLERAKTAPKHGVLFFKEKQHTTSFFLSHGLTFSVSPRRKLLLRASENNSEPLPCTPSLLSQAVRASRRCHAFARNGAGSVQGPNYVPLGRCPCKIPQKLKHTMTTCHLFQWDARGTCPGRGLAPRKCPVSTPDSEAPIAKKGM